MVQDIIVFLFILAALFNIAYQTRRLWQRKKDTPACGGCSQCEIKKNIIEHAHR